MPSTDQISSVPSIELLGRKAPPGTVGMFRREVMELLGRSNDKFPGAQPISFARKHLDELRERDYYVCEKSDGIRCLLYFTEGNGGEETHYLIDRNNDYYFVEGLHFPLPAPVNPPGSHEPPQEIEWASYHTATLLDGELLIDMYPDGHQQLKFLVFDCLYMDGQNLMSRTLDKRLAYFMEKVHEPYAKLCAKFPADAENFPFRLEKKSFQLAYGVQMMFMQIMPNLKHGSDGLIFTCRETPYQFGTDIHILKWKPAEENTIDFKLGLTFPPMTNGTETGDDESMEDAEVESSTYGWEFDYNAHPIFTLHVNHGKQDDRPHAEMFATPEEWESMKEYSKKRGDGLDGAIVECHQDSEGRWRFNRFREDKREANHNSTVEKVTQSIRDGVTKEELIAEAGDIRTAWKHREKEARDREQAERMRAVNRMVKPVAPP